jgi:hypothetical protein
MLSEPQYRPAARHVHGVTAEVDGAGDSRRGKETEQHQDCDGWTKQAHYRPNNCIRRSIRRMLKRG